MKKKTILRYRNSNTVTCTAQSSRFVSLERIFFVSLEQKRKVFKCHQRALKLRKKWRYGTGRTQESRKKRHTLRPHTLVTTHREILLNQPEIRFYSPFSDWFGTKQTSVWFKINRNMVNTIRFRFDLIRIRKKFSACRIQLAGCIIWMRLWWNI